MPVVDFGPGTSTSTVWMKWSEEVTPIRSVFWVVRTPWPGNNSGSLLSPSDGDSNAFARNTKYPNTAYETPRRLWWWEPISYPAFMGSITRIDGYAVDANRSGLDNDWHLVSLTLTPSVAAQAFGADRPGRAEDLVFSPGLRCGGILYAEVLIYDRALSADEVKNVEAYLTAKWLRAGYSGATVGGQSHSGENITLGTGGTLVLDGVTTNDVNVSGSGTVMNAAVPPTVWQVYGPRVFNRGLILADGATVYVDYDGNAPTASRIDVTGGLTVQGRGAISFATVDNWVSHTSTFPLFSYDTLIGGNNWDTLWRRGTGIPGGVTVKGSVDSGDKLLNATFNPSGTILKRQRRASDKHRRYSCDSKFSHNISPKRL
jgi:hypothetical protein